MKEGSIYVCENLNFKPDEFSYVEPYIAPKDPNEEPEEPPFEVVPPDVLKKMPAGEKAKYEEELRKHEERELAKSQPSEEEIARQLAIKQVKDKEESIRKKAEHFDSKSTYSYI